MEATRIHENGSLIPPRHSIDNRIADQQLVSRKPVLLSGWLLIVWFSLVIATILSAAGMARYPELINTTGITDSAGNESMLYFIAGLSEQQYESVNKGQQVQLRLHRYAAAAGEMVEGHIEDITGTDAKGQYRLRIRTTTAATAFREPGITADAIIILKDLSLLQRLFYNPRNLGRQS